MFVIIVIVIVVINVISYRVILSSAWQHLDHRSYVSYFDLLSLLLLLYDYATNGYFNWVLLAELGMSVKERERENISSFRLFFLQYLLLNFSCISA